MTDCGAKAVALFDAWEKRDFDTTMNYFAHGATVKDMPRGLVITERSDVQGWIESWVIACPDSTAGVVATVASSNGAVVQGVYAGTNTGPFGPLPATGRSVSMPFSIVMLFDDEGRVTEYDVYYDQLTLLTQLGQV